MDNSLLAVRGINHKYIVVGIGKGVGQTKGNTKNVRISTDKVRISTEKRRVNIDDLNANQEKIIQYIKENGRITNKEVQVLLHVKDSRALEVLKALVEAGILKKEGKLKGTCYVLQ